MPAQDLYGLPDNADSQQVFTYTGEAQHWNKPRGVRMVFMTCIGPGGGGGGGFTGATSTERCGGSGGGGGAICSLLIPAMFLPDVLWACPGPGGIGGVAGSASGSSPFGSTVAVLPLNSAGLSTGQAQILTSGGGGGGNAGSASAGGTQGTGAAATTFGAVASNAIAGLGVPSTYSGGNGAAGGANAAGGTLNQSNFLPWGCGGTGGGGCTSANADFAGGQLFALGSYPGFWTGAAGGLAAGGRGVDGFYQLKPLFAFGGTGGGSNAAGVGGAGGNGAPGCGGGGGGGGITGGPGGNGGSGLIAITCW
jgi:hypothetical protein